MKYKIAEFIGIMLGDGNLGIYESKKYGKIQHRIRISLDSRNKDYIDYVFNLMKDIFGIEAKLHYKKNENAVDIGIYRKDKFFYVVNEIGLKISPKWNSMEIPEKYFKKEFYPLILKGLFDTDGCLSVFNNNGKIYPRIEIKICPSPAQNQFIQILDFLDFNYKIQELDNKKIRIRISGLNELKKWFKIVGSSNQNHVEKSRIFLDS